MADLNKKLVKKHINNACNKKSAEKTHLKIQNNSAKEIVSNSPHQYESMSKEHKQTVRQYLTN